MEAWLREHETLLWWLGVASLVTFVGTLVVVPVLIARMPADFFSHPGPRPDSWSGRHPLVRWALLVAKNGLGGILVLAGIAMLLIPGQGILTILIGLALIDFPGKRGLELRLVRLRAVARAIGWIRAKAGRPPLELPG